MSPLRESIALAKEVGAGATALPGEGNHMRGKKMTARQERPAEGLVSEKIGLGSRVREDENLNYREIRLAKELAEGNSVQEALRKSGYSPQNAKIVSWWRRVHLNIRTLTLAHLARAGVTLPYIAQKHKDLLEAEQAIRLGKGEYEMVPANLVQHKAMETYLRILGPLGRVAGDTPEDSEGTTVVVNINSPSQRADPQGQGKEPVTIEVDG